MALAEVQTRSPGHSCKAKHLASSCGRMRRPHEEARCLAASIAEHALCPHDLGGKRPQPILYRCPEVGQRRSCPQIPSPLFCIWTLWLTVMSCLPDSLDSSFLVIAVHWSLAQAAPQMLHAYLQLRNARQATSSVGPQTAAQLPLALPHRQAGQHHDALASVISQIQLHLHCPSRRLGSSRPSLGWLLCCSLPLDLPWCWALARCLARSCSHVC